MPILAAVPPTKQTLTLLPLPPTVYLILLALADEDAHGYRIRSEVAARSGGLVRIDPGSLYRLIARMLADGLIAEATQQADDERRRCYRLTHLGRRLLRDETKRMADLVAGVSVKSLRPRRT